MSPVCTAVLPNQRLLLSGACPPQQTRRSLYGHCKKVSDSFSFGQLALEISSLSPMWTSRLLGGIPHIPLTLYCARLAESVPS